MDFKRHITDLYLLVQVVDAGGLSKAAKSLGTTRSLLSRRLMALEDALGARLLYRDARHFAMTPVGQEVYREAVSMCISAQRAVDAAHKTRAEGHALFTVSMHDALFPFMSAALTAFGRQHPHIRVSARMTDDIEMLLSQQTDILFRIDGEPPSMGNIVAHFLGHVRLVIVASPHLLAQHGQPPSPGEIDAAQRLAYTGLEPTPTWELEGADMTGFEFGLSSSHLSTVLEAARSGMGFVQLPLFSCREDIADGRLVSVFESFEPAPLALNALTLFGDECSNHARDFTQFVRKQLEAADEAAGLAGCP